MMDLSFKSRFLNPTEATRAGTALRAAGYIITDGQCNDCVMKVVAGLPHPEVAMVVLKRAITGASSAR